MNDEEMVSTDANESDAQTCDPSSAPETENAVPSTEESRESDSTGCDAPPLETPSAVSDDPMPDPDPVASADPESDPQVGLEQLRGELNRLRATLAERDAFWGRIGKDCEDFFTLYPDTAISELSDEVWEDVKRGIPIAAAYALSERRRALNEQRAAESNLRNSQRSSGALEATESDYFSPAEVRTMSQSEVRANYHKIMQSMQKWH